MMTDKQLIRMLLTERLYSGSTDYGMRRLSANCSDHQYRHGCTGVVELAVRRDHANGLHCRLNPIGSGSLPADKICCCGGAY